MGIHYETCRRTSPRTTALRASLPTLLRDGLIWTSGCDVHSRCCIPDVEDCQCLLLPAVALLQLPEVHVHRDHVIEHFGVSNGPPVLELTVPSADCTHRTKHVSGLYSRFVAHPSLLARVSPLVVLISVPGSRKTSQGHCSTCSNLSQPEFVKTPKMASTHSDSP